MGALIARPAGSAGVVLTVAPTGIDATCARNGTACGSMNRAYQLAQVGDVVEIRAGNYPAQTIESRGAVRDLAAPCAPGSTANCITFVPSGPVTINGKLEVRGSSVYVKGSRSTPGPAANATYSITVDGYADVEANSVEDHPDHVILEGIHAVSTGAFGVDTATFKDMDIGPATVVAPNGSCYVQEGNGFENKIGYNGDVSYTPRNVTWDGLRIHDQNGGASRELGFGGSGCHWGGLYIVTVDGLTIRNSVFERNVVYNIQVQNCCGAPPAKNVLIEGNSFGCPVDWQYRGEKCDGQRAIQFDYDPGTEFTLRNNTSANGRGSDGSSGLYGCYVGSCGGLAGLVTSGNVDLADSTTAPPIGPSSAPAPPASPTSPPAPGPVSQAQTHPPAAPATANTTPSAPANTTPSTPANTTPTAPASPSCSNGLDDDGDGRIDLADSGCTSHLDTSETDPVTSGGAVGQAPPPTPSTPAAPAAPNPSPAAPAVPPAASAVPPAAPAGSTPQPETQPAPVTDAAGHG